MQEPLEVLAAELGAVAGQIERESGFRIDAAISDMRRIDAERELRLTGLERRIDDRLADLKDGLPGASVTVDDVTPLISSEVDRVFSTVKVPKDGQDADPEAIISAVIPALEERLAIAVAAIPPAKPGRDAEPELIASMIAEQVSKLPAAEPGKDADPAVVRSMVEEVVAGIAPAPPGRDADLTEVQRMIDRALESLPTPEVKEDIAPADVAGNVALAIRMVAELPKHMDSIAPVINVHSNVTVPEAKAPQVNVTVPERATPVVNVTQPQIVIEAKRSKEVTKVTGYDKSGRITSFEKTEIDE